MVSCVSIYSEHYNMHKDVTFITVHVGENFGSNLQAIATSETLKSIGCTPLLINYIPQRVSKKYYWKTAFKNPVRLVWRIFRAPVFYKNHNIYDKFLAKYCAMSKPIYDGDDFVEKCPKADVYITGSDQVWNSHHNQGFNSRYYFDGIDGKKVAYASSFGVSKLPEHEYDEAKRLLKNYSFISVREKSGKEIVETMGYQAVQLLDPTFMLDAEGWEKYSSKRVVSDPYILVYIPYNIVDKDLIYKSVRRIAEKKILKVVTFSWGWMKDKYADITIRFANPGDFLSLMIYADYVITNSFHGTAFSINLNKQFWVYMPTGFSTRISSILDLCGLKGRLLDQLITDEQVDNYVDYEPVNEILKSERRKSIDFLTKAIE